MADISKIKLPSGTTYNIKDTVSGYTTNIGTITKVQTTAGAHTTINVSSGAATFNVPTKTSHLTNDSGFITNAGVTGVKGKAESSYRTGQVNLTPENIEAVARYSELQTTNPFAPPSTKGPYISKIDNAFYAADKRWTITATGTTANNSVGALFDGNYEGGLSIIDGNTAVISFDFSNESSGYFSGYPYGYILVNFYYTAIPTSVNGRVYCNYAPHGVGWHDIPFSPIFDSSSKSMVYRSEHQGYYQISKLEITIVGDTNNSYSRTQVTEIEMHLDRPDPSRNPFLSKYGPETLYYDLTAPNFIGNVTGNVSGSAGSVAWSGVSSKPTTLSGYGITDAKIASGTITLGSNTITPLTSSSTLNAAKLSGAIPSAVTATTQTAGDNSTKIATTAYVTTAIANLPEPMIFKGSVGTGGTVTSLPTAAASNEGWTYKVITALSSPAAEVGDTVISNGSSWVVIPSGDEPNGTVTSVGVSNATNGGLTVSGSPITSSGTITIGHSNVLTSAQTTQAVYPIKIDKNGHISAYGSAVTIPTVPSNIVNTITTTAGTHTAITSQKGNVSFNVPTKTSHLTNDSGFITSYTDEKLKIEAVSNNTYYPIVGANSTAASVRQYDSTGFSYSVFNGTTSSTGSSTLILGNNIAEGNANNKEGRIKLYSPKNGSAELYMKNTSTSQRLICFPDKSGTVALTSDIPTVPSSTGPATTGITASTTATKTTLGTAFTIPNVTSAGSASSWTFEEKTIPNVTAAGSGSASLTFTMDTTDTKKLKITFSHTHTAPTIGTAIKVQSKSGGSNGTAPTLGTAFTVPNVTGNTSATVSITDNGHTHTI